MKVSMLKRVFATAATVVMMSTTLVGCGQSAEEIALIETHNAYVEELDLYAEKMMDLDVTIGELSDEFATDPLSEDVRTRYHAAIMDVVLYHREITDFVPAETFVAEHEIAVAESEKIALAYEAIASTLLGTEEEFATEENMEALQAAAEVLEGELETYAQAMDALVQAIDAQSREE